MIRERLQALRHCLTQHNIDGYLIPKTDEFGGEYNAPYAERLGWLTGFTGSAGFGVVTMDEAALFVDGRYITQAAVEVDPDVMPSYLSSDINAHEWLEERANAKTTIAYDPWLFTENQLRPFEAMAKSVGCNLMPSTINPIDALWDDQPARPCGLIRPHLLCYAGESSVSKRTRLSEELTNNGIDLVILTASDSIAWLTNTRGSDVPFNPVTLGYALFNQQGDLSLFIEPREHHAELLQHLGCNITLYPLSSFLSNLTHDATDKCVAIDPARTPCAIIDHLGKVPKCIMVRQKDLCTLPKAIKNTTELEGMRRCHERDGLALVWFMHWLDHIPNDGGVTEIHAEEQLYALRRQNDLFQDLSFPTIAGFGPHGAIIHYRASKESNSPLGAGIFLLDSGAQYLDGTTDVTRTFTLGAPTQLQKKRYTQVLKGHIAIACAVFPSGTTGCHLDVLARHALWQDGVDYEHGTGHGVGSYLNVHEGPQSISKAMVQAPLEPGMIVSNEPGYYLKGEFGIRIESLVEVCKTPIPSFYGFNTLTLVPFEPRLIDAQLLDQSEVLWIQQYHKRIYTTLGPFMNDDEKRWFFERFCA